MSRPFYGSSTVAYLRSHFPAGLFSKEREKAFPHDFIVNCYQLTVATASS
jgi:hypothetical protein